MRKRLIYTLATSCLICMMACEKKLDMVGDYEPAGANSSSAYLKIIHAAPNFRAIFNAQDTFNVFVNNTKLTPAPLTYNGRFPFSVNATTNTITATYAAVPAGDLQIRLSNPGLDLSDSFTVATITKNLQAGKYYSLLITDSINLSRDSSQIFLNDQLPSETRQGYMNIRFIHAAMNSTDTIDLFSFARNANIASNIKPGDITSFLELRYSPGAPDSLFVRKRISATTPGPILAKFALNAANIGGGSLDKRSYTIMFKGDANLSSGTKSRSMIGYINY
jgi:Domain of unknown function (DUF4397)